MDASMCPNSLDFTFKWGISLNSDCVFLSALQPGPQHQYLIELALSFMAVPPSKASSARNWLHLEELLAKRIPWTLFQTSQAITKAIGCAPLPDGKTLVLKTAFTYGIEYGKVKLVPS